MMIGGFVIRLIDGFMVDISMLGWGCKAAYKWGALPVGITHLGDAIFLVVKTSVLLEALIWTPALIVLQLHAKPFRRW